MDVWEQIRQLEKNEKPGDRELAQKMREAERRAEDQRNAVADKEFQDKQKYGSVQQTADYRRVVGRTVEAEQSAAAYSAIATGRLEQNKGIDPRDLEYANSIFGADERNVAVSRTRAQATARPPGNERITSTNPATHEANIRQTEYVQSIRSGETGIATTLPQSDLTTQYLAERGFGADAPNMAFSGNTKEAAREQAKTVGTMGDLRQTTQTQVDAMTPQQYAAYAKDVKAQNTKIRESNLANIRVLKNTLSTYRDEGVEEIAIVSDGKVKTVPIEFAYKNILQAPKGSTYTPVKPTDVPTGFTVGGHIASPTLVQETGPQKQPGFIEGVIAPFYNIGATIYETGRAVKRELFEPGSGFEFRGVGMPTGDREQNPLNLPYVKKEIEKKPTVIGDLVGGKVPTLNEYGLGTIAGDVALATIPGNIRFTRTPKASPKGETPKAQTTLRYDDKPILEGGYNPPEYRQIKIPEPFVKESGLVQGKVPRLPNTEHLDTVHRIAELEKARLTGQKPPVEVDPFYDPAQNVPKTRAKEIGTYKVQTDELIGKTTNPLKDVLKNLPKPPQDLSTTGSLATQIGEAQKFRVDNPVLFSPKPDGTSPPVKGGGGGDWKSTKVELGRGIGMVINKKGGGSGGNRPPTKPKPPEEPQYKEREIKTKSGQVLILREQIILKKPMAKQIVKPGLKQKQALKQETKPSIKQSIKPLSDQKFKQPQALKQAQPQLLKQPEVYKFKQPQALKQAQPQALEQPELYKQKYKYGQRLRVGMAFIPQTQTKTSAKLEERPKRKTPPGIMFTERKNKSNKQKEKTKNKADFLGSTHVAEITGFRSKEDIVYGRIKTSRLEEKDIAQTTKRYSLRMKTRKERPKTYKIVQKKFKF